MIDGTFVDKDGSGKGDNPMETDGDGDESLPGLLVKDISYLCITKAIDYTLLIGLLILQFLRCSPPTIEDIMVLYVNDTIDLLNENITSTGRSIYTCDLSESQSSLFYGQSLYMNIFVLIAVAICVIFGAVSSIGVYLHARNKVKDLRTLPPIDRIYHVTNKILIVGVVFEIPVAFYWTPKFTLIVWILFAIAALGLILLNFLFVRNEVGDATATSVFATSTFLVGFSLFQLTGQISRYWVSYSAASIFAETKSGGINDATSTDSNGEGDNAGLQDIMNQFMTRFHLAAKETEKFVQRTTTSVKDHQEVHRVVATNAEKDEEQQDHVMNQFKTRMNLAVKQTDEFVQNTTTKVKDHVYRAEAYIDEKVNGEDDGLTDCAHCLKDSRSNLSS